MNNRKRASTVFHALTDGKDFYGSKKDAIDKVRSWKRQGEINLRIYQLWGYEKESTEREKLIFTEGNFPA